MVSGDFPSVRPLSTVPEPTGREGTGRPRDGLVASLPWIDAHQHTQTLSWNDQNKLSLGGCRAAVMIAYNPHWCPYRPVSPEDVRFQWDLAAKWTDFLDENHLFDTYVAVGIHTNAKVEEPERLFEVLPEYCRHDAVVAIGETGIEPVQYDSRWPIEEQKPVVRQQMSIAEQAGLPVILHTPTTKTGAAAGDEGWGGLKLSDPDPSIDYERAKLECTELDVELKDEAGLADHRLLIDHGNPSNVDYVMENTECYLGFSVSSPLKGVTTDDIAETIREYGPERIIVNSDMMGYRRCDFFCIPRTMQELYKAGIGEDALRAVFHDNPAELYGLQTG